MPTKFGKITSGASSPAKPALQVPVPLSITIAGISSSSEDMFFLQPEIKCLELH